MNDIFKRMTLQPEKVGLVAELLTKDVEYLDHPDLNPIPYRIVLV